MMPWPWLWPGGSMVVRACLHAQALHASSTKSFSLHRQAIIQGGAGTAMWVQMRSSSHRLGTHFRLPLGLVCPHQKHYAVSAEAGGTTEAVTSQPNQEDSSLAALRGVLARHLPDASVRDSSQVDSSKALRFGDLPATTQLVDSFQGATAPKTPVYDLPSWLASHFPRYDTRPKSPFYDWVSWVHQNLPADQAQLYLTLDMHMQQPATREAILRKAQHELTQLWDWQHRRIAIGLPLQPTTQELQEAAAQLLAAGQGQQQTQQQTQQQQKQAQGGDTQKTEATEASDAPKGLTGWLRKAAQAESVVQDSLKLTPEQLALVRSLRSGGRLKPSASSADLVSDLVDDLNMVVARFKRNIKPTSSPPAHRFDRASEILHEEYIKRQAAASNPLGRVRPPADLYAPPASSATARATAAAGNSSKLSPLDARLLSAAMSGSQSKVQTPQGAAAGPATTTWADVTVFNSQGGQRIVPESKVKAAHAKESTSDADARILAPGAGAPFASHPLHRQPYAWDIRVPPPTYMLDLLKEYWQVKYQDVMTSRGACQDMAAALETDLTSCQAASSRLSPLEVAQINRQATELFEKGDVSGYTQLMSRLVQDGFITDRELSDHVTAVQRRAVELQAGVAQLGGQNQPPPTASSSVVSSQQKGALLSLLTSTGRSTAVHSSSSESVKAAKEEWDRSLAAGTAKTTSLFTTALAAAVSKVLAAQQKQGLPVPASLSTELTANLARGQYISWEHAVQLWDSFLAASAAPASAPSLADVINTDKALRAAQAAADALPAKTKLPADVAQQLETAQQAADQLNQQLDQLYIRYLSRANTTSTFPVPAGAPAGVSAAASCQAFNAGLDVRNASQLLTQFQGSASVTDLLRSHFEQVVVTHLKGSPLRWSSTTPAWQQMWSLIRSLFQQQKGSSASLPSASSPASSSNPFASLSKSVSSPASKAAKDEDEEALKSVFSKSEAVIAAERSRARAEQGAKWAAYTAAQESQLSAGDQGAGLMQADKLMAPPYPGARPILRFTQCVVLSASSSLSSTQGLESRVSVQQEVHPIAARKTGYSAPPVLLPEHPAARRVEMRVHVADLAQEVGLGPASVKHMVKVAGPDRYDKASQELVLVGEQYASREENRKWCVEKLHLLLKEAHEHQQRVAGGAGITARKQQTSSTFVLTKPGVASMLSA